MAMLVADIQSRLNCDEVLAKRIQAMILNAEFRTKLAAKEQADQIAETLLSLILFLVNTGLQEDIKKIVLARQRTQDPFEDALSVLEQFYG